MPAHEFVFVLHLSDDGPYPELLREVSTTLLQHLGYPSDAIDGMVAQIAAARAQSGNPCDVHFGVGDGELRIHVTCPGGEWRTSCAVP